MSSARSPSRAAVNVHRVSDPVIGDAILAEIVRAASFFRSLAFPLACGDPWRWPLLLPHLHVEPRAQHFHRFARFLICDFSSCCDTTRPWECAYTDRRVVVLTLWPPGPLEQNVSTRRSLASILHVHFFRFRQDGPGCVDVWMRTLASVRGHAARDERRSVFQPL